MTPALRPPALRLPALPWPSRRTLLLGGAAVGLVVAGVAAWTVLASTLFCMGTGAKPLHGASASYEWWDYALNFPREYRAWPRVERWLHISGAAAAVPVLGMWAGAARFAWRHRAKLRPVRRGRTDNLGHADWMAMEEARQRFPGPDPVHGGIVVGEAYRVDQDAVARVPFNPRDPRTWGQGGKAPLLVDPLADGPLATMILAGAGGFKSSTLVTTLVHPLGWRASAVVMDPSCELGPMVRATREAMGHRVVELVPGGEAGFDAMGWIDTAHPEAETNVAAAVAWVVGMTAKAEAGEAGRWKGWGRDLVECLALHMMWADEERPARHKVARGTLPRLRLRRASRRSRGAVGRGPLPRLAQDLRAPLLPREFKTLRTLRAMVVTPADEMRKLLATIHARSNSQTARDLAGTMKDLVEETFSGLYQNATADTAWLSKEAFGGLVSGDTFRPSDLAGGKLTVLLQVPQKTLETTPAIARVVVGGLLNAVFEADGDLVGKVFFGLDEAVLLGPMPVLKTALTQGRKYGIALQPHYQDDGQVEEVWGKTGKRTWFSNLAWRSYSAVSDLEVAKEVSASCGEFAVLAASEGRNKGWQGRLGAPGSVSSGATVNEHEVKRELIKPAEILHDMRADERIVLPRGRKPLRCGSAIHFRRGDLGGRVGANRFAPAAARPGAGGQAR